MNEREHPTYVSPNAIRDILVRLWDPFGEPSARKDSYDRFIAPLYRQINDGGSAEEVEAKLHVFEQTLLTETTAEHRMRVATALVNLRTGH
jgi:hypothetical protein